MPFQWTLFKRLLHTPGWLLKGIYQAAFAVPTETSWGMRFAILLLFATGRKHIAIGDEDNMRRQIAESKENETPSVAPRIPKALTDLVTVRELTVDGMPKPWQLFLIEPTKATGKQFIVDFPGGAYIRPPIPLHFLFCYDLAHRTASSVLIVRYPLIPHPLATATQVVPTLANFLATSPLIPVDKQLVLMGDSAGGGLALSVGLVMAKEKKKDIKELILIAPWTDVSCQAAGIQEVETIDPMLRVAGATICGLAWSSAPSLSSLQSIQAPLPSPQFGDFASLTCRVTVVVGSHDILVKDNEAFVARFREKVKDEGRLEIRVWDGGIHCFPLASFATEATEAREYIATRIAE